METELIIKSPLRRMVFQNLLTGRYYHGLGREVTLRMSGKYTNANNVYKYIQKPLWVSNP